MRQPLQSVHSDAATSPGLLMWQVSNRWQAQIRAALRPCGLTHVQFVLLASLTYLQGDGPVTQRALADHAATDPMMTSQVVRALATRGLVERAAHPDDGRAVALTATPAGVALANEAVALVEACDAEFFGRLDRGQAGFVSALRSLAS